MPDTRHARPQAQDSAATAVHATFNQGLALHQQGKLRVDGDVRFAHKLAILKGLA